MSVHDEAVAAGQAAKARWAKGRAGPPPQTELDVGEPVRLVPPPPAGRPRPQYAPREPHEDPARFARLPEAVLFDHKLPAGAKTLYAVLTRYSYDHPRIDHPAGLVRDVKIRQLAADVPADEKTVRYWLDQLIERKHVVKVPRKNQLLDLELQWIKWHLPRPQPRA